MTGAAYGMTDCLSYEIVETANMALHKSLYEFFLLL